MPEINNEMSLGQVVDAISADYFAKGADALTANLCALRDVSVAFNSLIDHGAKLLSSVISGCAASNKEVPGND